MITPFSYIRIAMIYSSTALSLVIIMLVTNIISIEDLISILGIDQRSNEAQALKLVISRIQEMSSNIIQILSKLLNHLFSWAGVDVDLTKIKVDAKNISPSINDGGIQNPSNGQQP